MAEVHDDVDIIFCDIVGFDDIIKVEKEKTVEILDQLFRVFDELCDDRGLQKIETVGKTYMAATRMKKKSEQKPDDNHDNPTEDII